MGILGTSDFHNLAARHQGKEVVLLADDGGSEVGLCPVDNPGEDRVGTIRRSLIAVSCPHVRNRKRGLSTPSGLGFSFALVSTPASLRSSSNAPRMSTLSALKVNTMTPSSGSMPEITSHSSR